MFQNKNHSAVNALLSLHSKEGGIGSFATDDPSFTFTQSKQTINTIYVFDC